METLGQGFCYTDHTLVETCNANPHFLNDDRLLLSFFDAPEMDMSEDNKLLVASVTEAKVVKAPLTGICAPAKVMEFRTPDREIKTFDFAHMHLKNRIELCRADDPGLRLNDDGSFRRSKADRWRIAQQRVALYLRQSARLTEYSMAIDMLLYGMTDMVMDDAPSYKVDLCRPEDHTIDLTADESLGVCDPCFDFFGWIEEQSMKMLKFGANGPYDMIMDKVAAKALSNHPQFRNWYEKCCQNYRPPEEGTMANRAPEMFSTTKLLAQSADFRFWVTCGTICEKQEDEKGNLVEVDRPVIPEGSMIMFDQRRMRARRIFAPIELPTEGVTGEATGLDRIQSPFWLRIMPDRECSAVNMHVWSRPLPIIGCPGATIFAKIATKKCVDELCQCPPLGMDPIEEAPKAEVKTAAKTTAKKAAE